MAFWLWISAWSLIVGLWIHALFPKFGVHAAHLHFIGGFGLMTMMISSRVILSHGDHGLEAESNSRIYGICSILFILTALTRFSAPWTPNYTHHLGYAALCWILAISIWSCFFVSKILTRLKCHSH